MNSIKYKALTISTAVKGLSDFGFTAAELARAHRFTVIIENDEVRFCDDGTTATSTVGTPIAATGGAEYLDTQRRYDQEIDNFSLIRSDQAGGDAVAHATLYD